MRRRRFRGPVEEQPFRGPVEEQPEEYAFGRYRTVGRESSDMNRLIQIAHDVDLVLGTTKERAFEGVRRVSMARWLRDREVGSGGVCERAMRQRVGCRIGDLDYWPIHVKWVLYRQFLDECKARRQQSGLPAYAESAPYIEEIVLRCLTVGAPLRARIPTGRGWFCETIAVTGIRVEGTFSERVWRARDRTLSKGKAEYLWYTMGLSARKERYCSESRPHFDVVEYGRAMNRSLLVELCCVTCKRRACRCDSRARPYEQGLTRLWDRTCPRLP